MTRDPTTIRDLLEAKTARYHELEELLTLPETSREPRRLTSLVRELGSLRKLVTRYERVRELKLEIQENTELVEGDDEDLALLASEELPDLKKQLEAEVGMLERHLLTTDSSDSKNVIVEIRAGTGGDEASLFAADLFRMYQRYGDKRSWKMEVISRNASGIGGLKEIIFGVSGENVFRDLKYEAGGHRVQRVPETESQGRIHTSACTVAVLPEEEEVDLAIAPEELRIDTMCSSGPGGQHVNRTESAVRLTHLPTGIVVVCQDEKSQRRNREKAMRVLRSRLRAKLEDDARRERGAMRQAMIGSGDRSERIRTYNFPQNRLTDHRVGLTLYSLDKIILGDLDSVIQKLVEADAAKKLEALGIRPGWLDGG